MEEAKRARKAETPKQPSRHLRSSAPYFYPDPDISLINISHEAATPPGLEVTATVELIKVEGRKLVFSVEAHDGVDFITKGQHERFVINKEKFDARMAEKGKSNA
jgi:hypothetical protein